MVGLGNVDNTADASKPVSTATQTALNLKANLAGGTFTGQIVSTRANDTASFAGQIYLNGASGNRIDFNNDGISPPSFNVRSVGTKLMFYNSLGPSSADYATGMDANTLWNSVPVNTNTFKWYGGTTLAATLTGAGALTLNASTGSVSTPSVTTDNLTVNNFFAAKPWVGYRVTTSAGVASLTDAMGFKTTGVSVAHTSGSNPYTVTIPAHPSGLAYQVVAQVFTNTSNSGTVAIATAKVISDTSFIVWLRGAFGTGAQANLVEGDFYFHTVP
jgi:hypothetical protein